MRVAWTVLLKLLLLLLLLLQMLVKESEQAEAMRSVDSLLDSLEQQDLTGSEVTSRCFAQYLPQLERMGESWSQAYTACQRQAKTGSDLLYSQADGMRQSIGRAALGIEKDIAGCLNLANVLDYFECFGKLSKRQLATMYDISFNASQSALRLNQQLFGVDEERYLCTNRTEQSYVLGTARLFGALDKCLQQAPSASQVAD